MEIIIYVGMDVHKETYSVCCYDSRTNTYMFEQKIKASTASVLKYLKHVKEQLVEEVVFICGYEAGPTGFGLCRDLFRTDIPCIVMAPTSLKRNSSKKRKNDRVDAQQLAKALYTKDYSQVHLSTKKEEAIKEYCRMRQSLVTELKKAKQVLQAFLLRQGKVFEKDAWTKAHREWLRKLTFEQPYMQDALNEYLTSVNTLEARLKEVEKRLNEIAKDDEVKEKVEKLICFSGIDIVTAVSIVSEVGDFTRFGRAWDFSNFVGLTVGEDSSGQREKKLGITKSGNRYLRRLFTESAKSIKRTNPRGEKSKRLIKRQEGQNPKVIAYADKCRMRLRNKMFRLEMRGKLPNVASTAAARELACFVWGMMTDNIA